MRSIALILMSVICACRSAGSTSSSDAPGGAVEVIPLVLTFAEGAVDSQLVPACTATADGYLALDTGSALTFLYDAEERGGEVTIGADTRRTVIGRDLPGETFDGKPILGVLGVDFLLEHPSELDYPGGRIVRHLDGSQPVGTDAYAATPFVPAAGHVAVRVSIDGEAKLLLLDTGARDTLLLGARGRPGDERAQSAGVDGVPFDIFVGTCELRLAGEQRTVPILRAPSFPYFEGFAHELHPELAGLLGLTSLGFRRIIFDPGARTLRLGPIEEVR